MKNRNIYRVIQFQILWLLLLPFYAAAQNVLCDATTLEEFYACYGGQSAFSTHSVAAVTTFIEADDALQAGDYAQAKIWVDNLFNTYPKGSGVWWNVFNDPNGAKIWTPDAYYGLCMMEDILDYQINGDAIVQDSKLTRRIAFVCC